MENILVQTKYKRTSTSYTNLNFVTDAKQLIRTTNTLPIVGNNMEEILQYTANTFCVSDAIRTTSSLATNLTGNKAVSKMLMVDSFSEYFQLILVESLDGTARAYYPLNGVSNTWSNNTVSINYVSNIYAGILLNRCTFVLQNTSYSRIYSNYMTNDDYQPAYYTLGDSLSVQHFMCVAGNYLGIYNKSSGVLRVHAANYVGSGTWASYEMGGYLSQTARAFVGGYTTWVLIGYSKLWFITNAIPNSNYAMEVRTVLFPSKWGEIQKCLYYDDSQFILLTSTHIVRIDTVLAAVNSGDSIWEGAVEARKLPTELPVSFSEWESAFYVNGIIILIDYYKRFCINAQSNQWSHGAINWNSLPSAAQNKKYSKCNYIKSLGKFIYASFDNSTELLELNSIDFSPPIYY